MQLQVDSEPTESSHKASQLVWCWLSALVFILDQASKFAVVELLTIGQRIDVLPVFSWVLLYNEGAAFSILSNSDGWQRWFLMALSLLVSAWLVRELWRMPSKFTTVAIAYALILGGALGNCIDRVTHGAVVDFILVHWQDNYFPAFNIADSAISLGVVFWIFAIWQEGKNKPAA